MVDNRKLIDLVLYPWAGEFHLGNPESPVAVVTLSEDVELPDEKIAIYGNMKTENLGIEKVIELGASSLLGKLHIVTLSPPNATNRELKERLIPKIIEILKNNL